MGGVLKYKDPKTGEWVAINPPVGSNDPTDSEDSADSALVDQLIPYNIECVDELPEAPELNVIYVISGVPRIAVKKCGTATFLKYGPSYITGSGPAAGLYAEGVTDVSEIKEGALLYYWQTTAELTSANELRECQYDIVVSNIDGVITTYGGSHTGVYVDILTLEDTDNIVYDYENVTENTDLTPYLKDDTVLGMVHSRLTPARTEIVIDTEPWSVQPHVITQIGTIYQYTYDSDNSTSEGGPATAYVYPSATDDGTSYVYWVGNINVPLGMSLLEYDTIATIEGDYETIITTTGAVYTGKTEDELYGKSSDIPTDSFHTWQDGCYYVTLKEADGVSLESGYFKLTETLDGYATAAEALFYLEGNTLTENHPVDFKEVDGVYMMRDAGVLAVSADFKNPLSQKYQILYNGKVITKTTSDAKYVYLNDDFMTAKGSKIKIYCNFGQYTGANGVLNSLSTYVNGGSHLIGFKINAERTKNGLVGQWFALADKNSSQQAHPWFTNTSAATDDFTKEELQWTSLTSNKAVYYANGSTFVLEEIA